MDEAMILKGRHFTYDEAMDILGLMAQRLLRYEGSFVQDVVFLEDTEDSGLKRTLSNRPRTEPKMFCNIGVKELVDNCDEDGYVRDVDLVWAGKHITHEARHLYQMFKLYQKANLAGRDLDMARMDAIAEVFHGYGHGTYGYRPSEIDADACGFEDCVAYFNKHVRNGKTPVLDVKACLAARVHELKSWRGDKTKETCDDLVASLRARQDEYVSRGRPSLLDEIDFRQPYMSMRLKICEKWRDVIEDGDKKGVERDEELFAVMLDVNSFGADVYAGLDEEARRIRKMYPSRAGLIKGVGNKVQTLLNRRDAEQSEAVSSFADKGMKRGSARVDPSDFDLSVAGMLHRQGSDLLSWARRRGSPSEKAAGADIPEDSSGKTNSGGPKGPGAD